jgi:hypothetical protein
MEMILNNKSKSYERINLDTLLSFIKTNLSTFQHPVQIVSGDDTIVNIVVNNTSDKEKNSKKTKDIKYEKTFYEELLISETIIKFNPKMLKKFSNYPVDTDIFTYNINKFLIFDPADLSETSQKKIDYSTFTFFKSIIYSLLQKPKYSDLENFIKTLVKHVSYGGVTEFNYTKLKWNKKTLKDNINKNIIDESTIRVVNDYLHVNIFIFNEETELIEYGGSDYIPFKKNLFFYKYQNNYYPVFNKNFKYFSYDTPLVKYLLTNTDNITLLSHDQLTFKEEDLTKYINISILPEIQVNHTKDDIASTINKFEEDFSDNDDENNIKKKESESESESESQSEDESEDEINQELFEKLMKLSLSDIHKEAKKYNIQIKDGTKLKTKKELCSEISKVKK